MFKLLLDECLLRLLRPTSFSFLPKRDLSSFIPRLEQFQTHSNSDYVFTHIVLHEIRTVALAIYPIIRYGCSPSLKNVQGIFVESFIFQCPNASSQHVSQLVPYKSYQHDVYALLFLISPTGMTWSLMVNRCKVHDSRSTFQRHSVQPKFQSKSAKR